MLSGIINEIDLNNNELTSQFTTNYTSDTRISQLLDLFFYVKNEELFCKKIMV